MSIDAFDSSLTRTIQNWPPLLQPIMIAASFLGLPLVLIVVAVAAALTSWRYAHPRIALGFVAGLVGLCLNTMLKLYFQRARPDTLYATGMHVKSFSFPSGHAYGGMVVYGLFAVLAYKYLPQPWNTLVSLALALLIILIGLSRIYLGAHYPTDVVAGWALGAMTLLVIILVIKP